MIKLTKTTMRRTVFSVLIAGAFLLPVVSHATILFAYGMCNPSDGCDQSVNFTPANNGTTVVGDTNPPSPLYNVFIDSLEGIILHGSGSTVDTGVGGLGFSSILLRPQVGYAWGAVEFQLDTFNKDQPTDTGGLTFTVFDASNTAFTFAANFPWEGDKGENQHYHFHAIDGQVISKLQISYNDSLCLGGVCNTIQDIHNIDVNTKVIPAPSPAAAPIPTLSSIGYILLALALMVAAAVQRRRLLR